MKLKDTCFSSHNVWMWELNCKESWVQKNWSFWTVVLEKTLESPLNCKEIEPVHPKGNQSWVFIGRIDVEAETPILWPPHVKNWLIGKDPDSGKDWRWEEKKATEDWDDWMASRTRWTWVWARSEGYWWTGKTGVLQSVRSQRVGHDWATELNRWSVLGNVPCVLKENEFSVALRWNILNVYQHVWSNVTFKAMLMYCFPVGMTNPCRVLKSPHVTVLLFVSPIWSVNICWSA